MRVLAISLVAAFLLLEESASQSGACTRDINNLTVVDMCQTASYTLGRVLVSVTSSTMGVNSVCSCTLRGKTPSQNTATTFTFWQQGLSNSLCTLHHVTMVSWPPSSDGSAPTNQNITCTSQTARFSSPQTTGDVLLTQIRSDPATDFNYCLFLEPSSASDNIELTCQSGPPMSTSTSTTPTTSFPTPSNTSSSSTSRTSSELFSTSSASVPTFPSDAPKTSTSFTSTTAASTTEDDVMTPRDSSMKCSEASSPPPALVAVAVVGWLLTLALAMVVLVLSLRQRRLMKSLSERGTDNSAYTSLSDVTRTDLRADPSYSIIQSERGVSQPGGSDLSPGGVYETVEGDNPAVRN